MYTAILRMLDDTTREVPVVMNGNRALLRKEEIPLETKSVDFLPDFCKAAVSSEGYYVVPSIDNDGHAGQIFFREIKRAGTDGPHLRTILRADDIRHDISAHRRPGPDDQACLRIIGKLRHIGGDAAHDGGSDTGRQIAAVRCRREKNRARFLFLQERSHFLFISPAVIMREKRAVDHIDHIRAAGDQIFRVRSDAGTCQNGRHLISRLSRQLPGFAQKLAGHFFHIAAANFGNDINSFIFRKIHGCPP